MSRDCGLTSMSLHDLHEMPRQRERPDGQRVDVDPALAGLRRDVPPQREQRFAMVDARAARHVLDHDALFEPLLVHQAERTPLQRERRGFGRLCRSGGRRCRVGGEIVQAAHHGGGVFFLERATLQAQLAHGLVDIGLLALARGLARQAEQVLLGIGQHVVQEILHALAGLLPQRRQWPLGHVAHRRFPVLLRPQGANAAVLPPPSRRFQAGQLLCREREYTW